MVSSPQGPTFLCPYCDKTLRREEIQAWMCFPCGMDLGNDVLLHVPAGGGPDA